MGVRWIALSAAALLLVPGSAVAVPTPDTPSETPTPTAVTPTAPAVTPEPSQSTPAPTTSTPTPTPPPPTAAPAPPKYVERSYVVGTTAKGRKIMAYFKGWPSVKNAHTLVVIGQMHGNEKAGLQTIDWLRKYQKPKKYTSLWLIPTMNPDGNAKNSRRNSRGVDLNRNWPTSGWSSKGKGSGTWGGKSRASERETKAMLAFFKKVRPDYVVSLHQPFGVVAKNSKDAAFEKRLASGLGLKRKGVGVGTAKGKTSPTMVGWYNRYLGRDGTAVTVEYRKKVKKSWSRKHAGIAITGAARVR